MFKRILGPIPQVNHSFFNHWWLSISSSFISSDSGAIYKTYIIIYIYRHKPHICYIQNAPSEKVRSTKWDIWVQICILADLIFFSLETGNRCLSSLTQSHHWIWILGEVSLFLVEKYLDPWGPRGKPKATVSSCLRKAPPWTMRWRRWSPSAWWSVAPILWSMAL